MENSPSDTSGTFVSSLYRFMTGTLCSRFTGLAREVAMAAAFGTHPSVAAFWMAFRFANLFRRLFGEGALQAAFVPHFERVRQKSPQEAFSFYYQLVKISTLLLLTILFVGEAILLVQAKYCTHPTTLEVLYLTMLLGPALLFLCLYALNAAFLQCHHSFFLPNAAPGIFNLIWILAVFLLWRTAPVKAMFALSIWVVFACAFQWLITVPKTWRLLHQQGREWRASALSFKEFFALLSPLFLSMVGIAATQLNGAVDALFARSADPSGPAILWYALRLQQLPLALLGLGVTGALLPLLARALHADNLSQATHLLRFALQRTITLMIPVTGGVLVLGYASVTLIYGRGAFGQESIAQTVRALWAYGVALLPMTLVLIFASAFYALREYKLPTLLSILAVGSNALLNTWCVYGLGLGAVSVAIATSITALLQALALGFALAKRYPGLFDKALALHTLLLSLLVIFVSIVVLLVGHLILNDRTLLLWQGIVLIQDLPTLWRQLFSISMQGALFLGLLYAGAYLLRLKELLTLVTELRKKALS